MTKAALSEDFLGLWPSPHNPRQNSSRSSCAWWLELRDSWLILPRKIRQGFRNANLRDHVAQLLGFSSEAYSPGRMTYDLKRLRLHGIIAREAGTHRYHVAHEGMRICLFMTKVHHRVIRPGFSQLMDGSPKAPERAVVSAMKHLDHAIDQIFLEAKIAV